LIEASGDLLPVEIVERMGHGHPDTICDHLTEHLSHFVDRVTRVKVHLSDAGGSHGDHEMRCMIEVCPLGADPVVAADQPDSIEGAVTAAAIKASAVLDSFFGKLSSRKGHK
jgi:hypothetical protein